MLHYKIRFLKEYRLSLEFYLSKSGVHLCRNIVLIGDQSNSINNREGLANSRESYTQLKKLVLVHNAFNLGTLY